MFKQFSNLYEELILNVIVNWLILFITCILILFMYFSEEKFVNFINKKISDSKIIIYLRPKANIEVFIAELENKNFLEKIKLISNLEAILEIVEGSDLKNLPKWIDPLLIPNIIVASFSYNHFTANRVLKFEQQLQDDIRVNSWDFEKEKMNFLSSIKASYYTYRLLPFYILILISTISLWLNRRLIRHKSFTLWKLWLKKGKIKQFRFQHFLIEYFAVVIILFMIFGLILYFWGESLKNFAGIKIFELNIGWSFVFIYLGIYFCVSSLNLIGKIRK